MADENDGTQQQAEGTQPGQQQADPTKKGEGTQQTGGKTYTDADVDAIIAKKGSSPRVRGTAPGHRRLHRPDGIIPARAGNSRSAGSTAPCSRDHPRACGEQAAYGMHPIRPWGSSPRVRGTVPEHRHTLLPVGIIPARAGNSHEPARCHERPRDHPRACGEQMVSKGQIDFQTGSSPRVRGTAPHRTSPSRRRGIIPARAGNSWPQRPSAATAGDHPRACGEQARREKRDMRETGSSPRVRGTGRQAQRGDGPGRIIPARAGNSDGANQGPTPKRDHPRACGEQRLGDAHEPL